MPKDIALRSVSRIVICAHVELAIPPWRPPDNPNPYLVLDSRVMCLGLDWRDGLCANHIISERHWTRKHIFTKFAHGSYIYGRQIVDPFRRGIIRRNVHQSVLGAEAAIMAFSYLVNTPSMLNLKGISEASID